MAYDDGIRLLQITQLLTEIRDALKQLAPISKPDQVISEADQPPCNHEPKASEVDPGTFYCAKCWCELVRPRKPVPPPQPEPLKPCPFCGGEARFLDQCPEHGWYQCNKCHTVGPCAKSEPEARAAWNRRAS